MRRSLFLLALLLSCHRTTQPTSTPAASGTEVSWKEALSPEPLVSALDETQKKEYEFLTNALLCPCGDHTDVFAACIEARQCPEALQAARMSARLLAKGVSRSDVEVAVVESFGGAPAVLSTEGAPFKGNPNASVTIVEFADFECPFCADLFPILQKVAKLREKDVKVVFKFYPIPHHPFGFLSAEAGAFAHSHGKFWELHDLMFSRQQEMNRENIKAWAKEVGLDPEVLESSWLEAIFQERVKRDQAEGDALKISGTPTLFINGRVYNEGYNVEALSRAIDEAMIAKKAGKKE